MRAWVAVVALALSLGLGTTAHADPDEAKSAYDAGAAAYDSGDYGRAANAFARADELQPNDMVLAMGLRSATRADDALLAMTLATRADERGAKGETATLAAEAKKRFANKVGRIRLECSEAPCAARIEGREISSGGALWLRPGRIEITLALPKRSERRTVAIIAGKTSVVTPDQPTPITTSDAPTGEPRPVADDTHGPKPKSGLSPVWFWSGVGLTTVLAGVSIWSSLDTKTKHDEFADRPSDSRADEGKGAQLRTNVLWGVTAGVGLTTVALGAFATRWGSAEATLSASGGGARLGVRASF